MPTTTHDRRLVLPLLLCGLALVLLAAPAVAQDAWVGDEPARTKAGDLEAHETEAGSIESRESEPQDPDRRVAEPGKIGPRESEPEDPGAGVGDRPGPDRKATEAGDLGDLPLREGPHELAVPFEVPDPASWAPTTDARVRAARDAVAQALARTERALDRYSQMRDDNYPSGEPRRRIVRERDEAIRALQSAIESLEAAEVAAAR